MSDVVKVKKKHTKDERSKKIAEGIEESRSVDSMKAAESGRMPKKEKKKKIKVAENAEAEMKFEGELAMVSGENGGGIEMDISERNGESCSGLLTVDNAERKRKKKGKKKCKNENLVMHDTEEAKGDESISGQDRGSVSGKKSGKEVMEKKKKRKLERNDIQEGEKDGEVSRDRSENCSDMGQKRKKDERQSKDEDFGSVQQEKSAEGIEESRNVDSMKAAESARMPKKECISEMCKEHKRGKEKKKIKVAENAEADMKCEGELAMVFGENGGGIKVDISERNGESCSGLLTVDNAERERKKREKKKSKNENLVMHDTEEAKGDESISGKEVMETKKKRKSERNDIQEGEKDGELVSRDRSENSSGMRKKRKKDERKSKDGDVGSVQQEKSAEDVEDHTLLTAEDANGKTDHGMKKRKKHKKKENIEDDLAAAQQEYSLLNTSKTQTTEAEVTNKRKKKKTKILKSVSDGTSPNKSNKKVRFCDQDKIFPLPANSNAENVLGKEDNLVRGKRFTPEENEILKNAVLKYIEDHALGDKGVDMVMNSSKHPELRGCWKEIACAIPYRPYTSIYWRGRILFMRSESRKWTQEEYDMLKKHHEKHGPRWRELADALGKHQWQVGDTWRWLKVPNLKKGHWSQDEYQKLFDLVNCDLQLKVSQEKKSKHGMLKDNISWTAISDSLSTRYHSDCCHKWYKQLTSPMVAEGVWADSDDYRLISELYSLDATCLEDVEWDDLIENRSGDVCRKRWSQMVQHTGFHGNKPFAEQVEVLAQRYCPHLLEARVAWDNKPRVP